MELDGGEVDWGRNGERASRMKFSLVVLSKIGVIFLFFMAWFVVYDRVNRYSSDPVRTIHLSPPYQTFPWIVQPACAIVYVFGGALLPALPFLYHRRWRGIFTIIVSYGIASMLAFSCYLIWPISMVRPIYRGEGLGESLMLWVFSKDLPGNCFPSSHVFFATLGALFVSAGASSHATRAATWSLSIAVWITTISSGQHYFMDVPGGIAVALAGYFVARKMIAIPGWTPSPGLAG